MQKEQRTVPFFNGSRESQETVDYYYVILLSMKLIAPKILTHLWHKCYDDNYKLPQKIKTLCLKLEFTILPDNSFHPLIKKILLMLISSPDNGKTITISRKSLKQTKNEKTTYWFVSFTYNEVNVGLKLRGFDSDFTYDTSDATSFGHAYIAINSPFFDHQQALKAIAQLEDSRITSRIDKRKANISIISFQQIPKECYKANKNM